MHTVDSNGNGLGQSEAIGALKGRDLAQGAELDVLCRAVERGVGIGIGLDQIQSQVVALRSDQDGNGARVVLLMLVSPEHNGMTV